MKIYRMIFLLTAVFFLVQFFHSTPAFSKDNGLLETMNNYSGAYSLPDDEIKTRLPAKSKPSVFLIWTEKNEYHLNDEIKIVVESKYDNLYQLKLDLSDYENVLKPLKSEFNTIIENGKTSKYNVYYFKAIGSGTVIIKPHMLTGIGKKIKANSIQFFIND